MDHPEDTDLPPWARPTGPDGGPQRRPPDRPAGEAKDADTALLLRWARVLAVILVIAPLGVLSCVGFELAGLSVDRLGGPAADSARRAENMRLLMIPAGIIVAALFSVIAGGGRGWLAIAANAIGGLAIAALGLWGVTVSTNAWWPILLYLVALVGVGGALIVGAYLRLGQRLHARGAGRS
jgi:hypothetical protein